ncbi:hypothetical protein HDU97_003289 [Phlyctochytrium planicorne]|nr:hypothetical protein HDU97_003289 [Phlyctochytrium planicorne]
MEETELLSETPPRVSLGSEWSVHGYESSEVLPAVSVSHGQSARQSTASDSVTSSIEADRELDPHSNSRLQIALSEIMILTDEQSNLLAKIADMEREKAALVQQNNTLLKEQSTNAFTSAAIIELRNATEESLQKALASKAELQIQTEELRKELYEVSEIKNKLQAELEQTSRTSFSELQRLRSNLEASEGSISELKFGLDSILKDLGRASGASIQMTPGKPAIDLVKDGVSSLLNYLNEVSSQHQLDNHQSEQVERSIRYDMKCLQENCTLLQMEKNAQQEKIIKLEEELKQIQGRLDEEISKKNALSTELTSQRSELSSMKEVDERRKASNDLAAAEVDSLKSIRTQLMNQIDSLSLENSGLKKKADELTESLASLSEQNSQLDSKVLESSKLYDHQMLRNVELGLEMEAAKKRVFDTQNENNTLKLRIADREARLSEYCRDNEALLSENAKAINRIKEQAENIEDLKNKLEVEKATKSEALMKALNFPEIIASNANEEKLKELQCICMDLNAELVKSEESLRIVEKERNSLGKYLTTLQTTRLSEQNKIQALEGELKLKNVQLTDMIQMKSSLEEDYEKVIKGKEDQISKLTSAIFEANARITILLEEKESIRKSQATLQEEKARLDKGLSSEIQKAILPLQTEVDRLQIQLQSEQYRFSQLKSSYDELESKITDTVGRFRNERDDARSVAKSLQQELHILTQEANARILDSVERLKLLSSKLESSIIESKSLKAHISTLEDDLNRGKSLLSSACDKVFELEIENQTVSEKQHSLEATVIQFIEDVQTSIIGNTASLEIDATGLVNDSLFKKFVEQVQNVVSEERGKNEELCNEINEAKSQHERLKLKLEEAGKLHTGLQSLFDENQKKINEMQTQLNEQYKLNEKLKEREQDLETISANVRKFKELSESLQQRLNNSEELAKFFEESIDHLNSELSRLRERSMQTDQERDSLRFEINRLVEEKRQLLETQAIQDFESKKERTNLGDQLHKETNGLILSLQQALSESQNWQESFFRLAESFTQVFCFLEVARKRYVDIISTCESREMEKRWNQLAPVFHEKTLQNDTIENATEVIGVSKEVVSYSRSLLKMLFKLVLRNRDEIRKLGSHNSKLEQEKSKLSHQKDELFNFMSKFEALTRQNHNFNLEKLPKMIASISDVVAAVTATFKEKFRLADTVVELREILKMIGMNLSDSDVAPTETKIAEILQIHETIHSMSVELLQSQDFSILELRNEIHKLRLDMSNVPSELDDDADELCTGETELSLMNEIIVTLLEEIHYSRNSNQWTGLSEGSGYHSDRGREDLHRALEQERSINVALTKLCLVHKNLQSTSSGTFNEARLKEPHLGPADVGSSFENVRSSQKLRVQLKLALAENKVLEKELSLATRRISVQQKESLLHNQRLRALAENFGEIQAGEEAAEKISLLQQMISECFADGSQSGVNVSEASKTIGLLRHELYLKEKQIASLKARLAETLKSSARTLERLHLRETELLGDLEFTRNSPVRGVQLVEELPESIVVLVQNLIDMVFDEGFDLGNSPTFKDFAAMMSTMSLEMLNLKALLTKLLNWRLDLNSQKRFLAHYPHHLRVKTRSYYRLKSVQSCNWRDILDRNASEILKVSAPLTKVQAQCMEKRIVRAEFEIKKLQDKNIFLHNNLIDDEHISNIARYNRERAF